MSRTWSTMAGRWHGPYVACSPSDIHTLTIWPLSQQPWGRAMGNGRGSKGTYLRDEVMGVRLKVAAELPERGDGTFRVGASRSSDDLNIFWRSTR